MNNCARRILKILAGFALFMALIACVSGPVSLRERLDTIPEKHIDFYNFDPSTALVDRIIDIPGSLLALWRDAEKSNLLCAYTPSATELEILEEAILMLPAGHRRVLEERLTGVFLVENFAGRGMADYILGSEDSIYAYILINAEAFGLSASELVTTRALSAFRDDHDDIDLEISVLDNDSNDVSGIFYILLHETSHVVDYVERHTPYVENSIRELFGRSEGNTRFTDELWTDYGNTVPAASFSHRDALSFYGLGDNPLTPRSRLVEVYEGLSETGFASLYGASVWAEDFAEFVTFYYLIHELGATYRIAVSESGANVFVYEPMNNPKVTDRLAHLDVF